jgi:YHS domain-containing protein
LFVPLLAKSKDLRGLAGRGVETLQAQCLRIFESTQTIMKTLNRFHKLLMTGAALMALAVITATAEDKKAALIPDKLTTCPVSGDKLGEMGKPYVMEYKGREVKLCCPDCKKDFEANPAKYMKKIEAADKAADSKKDTKN